MKRREFIALVGGLAMLPKTVHAQQAPRMRRVGVLMALTDDDPEGQAWSSAFRLGLGRRNWTEGRNMRIDFRFTAARGDRVEAMTGELLALQPDVVLAQTTAVAAAMKKATQLVPIVFVHVSDPIRAGLVSSLARPGGNVTGVLHYEAGIVGKWLAMLKEINPGLVRAAVLANSRTTAFEYFLRSAQTAAPSLGIEIVPARVETAADIERVMGELARLPNTGLVLPPDATTILHHHLIVELAARHRLPAVYALRLFAAAGGLMSYGTDQDSLFRLAASYVDRILRGDKPTDLPVQAPTRYETAINLKTAKGLGLGVPAGLLVAADEVID